MERPWLKHRGFRRKAYQFLKTLQKVNSLNGTKNKVLWEKLVEHFGGEQEALNAFYPEKGRSKICVAPKVNRQEYRAFYDSDDWKRLRYQALLKHGAACQCCGATRADGVKLHVDHIKPRSKYPELELSLDNLQILCEPCNMGKRAWDETDWREHPPGRDMVLWAD